MATGGPVAGPLQAVIKKRRGGDRASPTALPTARAAKAPPSAAGTPAKAATTASTRKGGKAEKPRVKLVRDSFTMPQTDFALIDTLKARALGAQRPARKSELLRAGLHTLAALPAPALTAALDALTPIKTGRPKKLR